MAGTTLTKPIAFNEASFNVVLLHQTLKVLGLPVAPDEVKQKRAGQKTEELIRALQAQLNVPIETTALVAGATASAIADVLDKRGLTAADRSFTITGVVRLQDRLPRRQQKLLAFEVDIRGVGAYRAVKKVSDLDTRGGFAFLGSSASDNLGEYRLTFYDWQYRRPERKQANIVVYAVDDRGDQRIIGYSRLVNSADYSDKGLVQGVDIIVDTGDKRAEYEALTSQLDPFLKEGRVSLSQLAGSDEQLAFAASELDVDPARVIRSAESEMANPDKTNVRWHELLYGLGRQGIGLSAAQLSKKSDDELRSAIKAAVASGTIRPYPEREISAFLQALRANAIGKLLDPKATPEGNVLNEMLSHALPKEAQRSAFITALSTFRGAEAKEFWSQHLPVQPEFKGKPGLVSKLLLTQQLTMLTGNHQPLVAELLAATRPGAATDLLDLKTADWLRMIKKVGVPDFVQGADDRARTLGYAAQVQAILNASFPTARIARMVSDKTLPIDEPRVANGVASFLRKTEAFDFTKSRVYDFDAEIKAAVGKAAPEVKSELMRIQRIFQVSTTPEAMSALLKKGLTSSYTIANIPRKSFINTYARALGGEDAALAIHERASHLATKAEFAALHLLEYSRGEAPQSVMGTAEYAMAISGLAKHIPNYAELFGSPDMCQCEQCRSVYSAAAYFVDLLRFLWRGEPNDDGKTPLDILTARRPDLLQLRLTCENTNTLIPYVDLANEVMEYYAANDSLTNFAGYDTGEATAEELRANPQNFDLEAYRNLKNAKYPFTLPYHQPLDVIRTYSDHLNVNRYEVMKAMNPTPDATTASAIAAESLRLSEEEYIALTGEAFDGTADTTPLYQYFGYTASGQIENMSAVREFLLRSGVSYTQLVELVKTQFLNPYQNTLAFLQKLSAVATIDETAIYTRLGQIKAGTLDPASDPDIVAALNAYNTAQGTAISTAQFAQWVVDHFSEFQQVISLYEPDSKCDLDTTSLRSIKSIYTNQGTSGLTSADWSKIHRFIRMWRKLGWSIHETDLLLAALGESDITAQTINKFEWVDQLKTATNLPVSQLAVLWGNIDTYGSGSLYAKLFLNKAVQQIDKAFEPDAWGGYLQDTTQVLVDHRSAILAAFRMREEDLSAILEVANVIDAGIPRPLDMQTDGLNLANLSTIYRHAVFAKALKIRIPDLTNLIALFGVPAFSTWDVQQEAFVGIQPDETFGSNALLDSIKKSGFKAAVLEYVLRGTLSANSTVGLDPVRARQTVKAIRDSFVATEQNHPETPPAPLSSEIVAAKLSLTFQPEIVNGFVGLLDNTAHFETTTDMNLAITIPQALSDKYTYVKGSGRLTCTGVMPDDERATLKGLAHANGNFRTAVDKLYTAPEGFIAANFSGIFADLVEANAMLLDHPLQAITATLEDKLLYAYGLFVPILKNRLRREAIAQQVAALIGLTEEATTLLLASDMDNLVTDLGTGGFAANYFSDVNWNTSVLKRTDGTIEFDWGASGPGGGVPADSFSVRWEARIAAPASGEYTLLVDVAEADEAFRLYLDDALILEKVAGDANTSWEVVTTLNATAIPLLKVEYAETSQSAGVKLRWKRSTTAPEIVPASVAYPATIVDAFVRLVMLYHQAAKLIRGFALTDIEVRTFIDLSADFGNIDFKALTADHWIRLRDFTTLRKNAPQAQALLTDVFGAASATSPVPTVADLRSIIRGATGWDDTNLQYLIDTQFALGVADFRNEIALNRVRKAIAIVDSTGLSAQTLADWGAPETDFDALDATAQLLKNTVKAGYEDRDWLDIAGDLSNRIREHQKQALVAYLLTQPAVASWGAKDADGLFEYFLIDVQMGTCMDTSRIVQSNAAIQMFVNRCLLNLESDASSGKEKGASPGSIDRDRWEWMKNYRVWEANRKVMLYAENWLEPEWRKDRSEFFKDLESFLVQNDITDRTVEQGFRRYLANLNDVANLDISGIHEEKYDDGTFKYLHVFARTHTAPYKFFYRKWNQYGKWSPWERVSIDIRSVETAGAPDGDNSGIQLAPVVWKHRLFLFWPEFMHVPKPGAQSNCQSAKDAASNSLSTLESVDILEIRLASSEYVDGKWTPKQVTKEYLQEEIQAIGVVEKDFLFTPLISTAEELTILVTDTYMNLAHGQFVLSDIQSPVRAQAGLPSFWKKTFDYRYAFSKRTADRILQLESDVYLRNVTNHNLLPVDSYQGLDPNFDDPFFFSDTYRTYFVRPKDIWITDKIANPGAFMPYLPGLVETSPPIPVPPVVGPDDYMPTNIGKSRLPLAATTIYFTAERLGRQPEMLPYGALGMLTSRASATLPTVARGGVVAGVARAGVAGRSTQSTATRKADTSSLKAQINQGPYIGEAFGGGQIVTGIIWGDQMRLAKGLEFHTFYHPFSGEYVRNLNQGGLPGLMRSDTTIPSDEGTKFETTYDPDIPNLVQKPAADFSTRTYYKENICFDPLGANSMYNMELFFFAPLYVATRLSKNGRFEEAMKWFHYIFDPTTDEMPGPGESDTSRYWKVLPFKTTPADSLEDWFRTLAPNSDPNTENSVIGQWRDNPFDAHLIAANRPLAYMKHVVIKYVENLIAWGDSLFRQATREAVYEAIQIYVIANHILGPRPEVVPQRGTVKAESYETLKSKLDDFSNALVQLENLFPYSSQITASTSSTGTSLLGVGSALYFCIPPNENLLDAWNTVADRLFKIRHCQNIEGEELRLALFAPPIEPSALIQAASQGLSLGSILADLNSPPPIYRFSFLVEKANEFCSDVKALGAALLSALEKKDGEELGRLRASHETQLLELTTGIRERQLLDAKANRESLDKSRESAAQRLKFHAALLGNDSVNIPPSPTISATLGADSQLPADTSIADIAIDVDQSLVDSGERGVKLIPKEKEALDKSEAGKWVTAAAGAGEALAGIFSLFPELDPEGTPMGVGLGALWGGQNLGPATSAVARAAATYGAFLGQESAQAATMASYIRRDQNWSLEANRAAREIVQLDKQITSADIKIQVAQKELDNHKQQIANAKAVEQFLEGKFTNQELYQWMKERLLSVHKQSYNLAYDMAKKAEKAYKYEMGSELASFIQYGYWDNSKQGLLAGENLQLGLRQLEQSFLDENRRELELTKSISLARVDSLALVELRETGKCHFSLPEELFDLDYQGHYFRRIKGVRVSIPAVAGPYTSVSCSLRLQNSSVRINTGLNSQGTYEHENDEGAWIDDDRFRSSNTRVTTIATSHAQNDSGMFEFNFRDERYLPFERAGVISDWQAEMTTDKELRQLDASTIADFILHIDYTAKSDAGLFKDKATDHVKEFLNNVADFNEQPLTQMFSMKYDFPTEWYRFLHPPVQGSDQVLNFIVGHERLPFFVQERDVAVMGLTVLASSSKDGDYNMTLTYTKPNADVVVSTETTTSTKPRYGDLKVLTLDTDDAGLALDELDIGAEMTLKLKRQVAPNYKGLSTDPDEIDDLLLAFHYKLIPVV